jgi:hypothetical protein
VNVEDIPDVEAGIFRRCPRCARWWHEGTDGVLRGPLQGVTGGPTMRHQCATCDAADELQRLENEQRLKALTSKTPAGDVPLVK